MDGHGNNRSPSNSSSGSNKPKTSSRNSQSAATDSKRPLSSPNEAGPLSKKEFYTKGGARKSEDIVIDEENDNSDFVFKLLQALEDDKIAKAVLSVVLPVVNHQLEAQDMKIRELEREVANLQAGLDGVEAAQDDQEQYSRRCSLRIYCPGPEAQGESTDAIVTTYA